MNHSTRRAAASVVVGDDELERAEVVGDAAPNQREFLVAPEPQVRVGRSHPSPSGLRSALIGADLVAVATGLAVTLAIMGRPADWTDGETVAAMGGLAVIWVLVFGGQRLHTARYVERVTEESRRVVTAGALTLLAILGAAYLLDDIPPSRSWTLVAFGAVTSTVLLERMIARGMFRRLRSRRQIVRRVAVVGTDDAALELYECIEANPSLGYDIIGLIGDTGTVTTGRPVLSDLNHAVTALRAHECVGVIVSTASLPMSDANALARSLTEERFHVAFSTNLTDIDLDRLRPQSLDGHTLLYVEPAVRSGWRASAKRCFDIVVAGTLLVVFSPIILTASLAVKLTSPGPVIFRQVRVGRDGRLFEMLKLRTMVVDAEEHRDELLDANEADGPLFKIQDDPRVTSAGRFLRKWSVDELPQLWNVLRGDMSMVGPRPALPQEVEDWDPELRRRLTVPAGLTGLWQVSGRSDASFAVYRRLDLYYVDNWTLAHDLSVCLRTAWAVVRAKGSR